MKLPDGGQKDNRAMNASDSQARNTKRHRVLNLRTRKRRKDPQWKCENPDCFLGGIFRKTGPSTLVGVGAWCLHCKGGTICKYVYE